MTTRAKILVFMILMLGLYGIFIGLLVGFNTNQTNIILSESREQKRAQMNTLAPLLATSGRTLASDYSVWDDMVSYIKKPNTDFARINLDVSLNSFKVNVVWVYSAGGNLVYSVSNLPQNSPQKIEIPRGALEIISRQRIYSFYLDTPHGVLEVHGATVHPSTDDARETPPQGFWLTGKLLDSAYLQSFSDLSGGTVRLRNTQIPSPETSLISSRFSVTKPLYGWNGTAIVGYLDAEFESTLADRLSSSSANFINISLLYGVVSLGSLFLLLHLFVRKPLYSLSQSLHKKSSDLLKDLEEQPGEFRDLAFAIEELFSQQVKIEQEKSRSEALLESISDGIIGIDRNWNIVFLNKSAQDTFGVPSKESLGKPLRDFLTILRVRNRSEYLNFIEDALLYAKPAHTEEEAVIISPHDASEIPVTISAAPIVGANRKTNGAVIILHDARGEQESRMLRSDVTYASHQLRTPVTEAMWAVGAALNAHDQKTKDIDLRIAAHSLKSIHKLVEHLLEVSQIDQGVILPKAEKIDAHEVVASAIASVEEKAHERGIAIHPPQPSKGRTKQFKTDKAILEKILFEVIENASSYADPQTIVRTDIDTQDKGVLFSVQNIGKPIAEKELPLVFTKFFRGSHSTEGVPGAGLGLYIAREYTKLLKGKLWFTSDPSATTFFIFIPYN